MAKNKSQIKLANLLKLFIAGILFIFVCIPVLLHILLKLHGTLYMSVHTYSINSMAELPMAVKNLYYSTQWMSLLETILFVIIPSFLICVSVWLIIGSIRIAKKPIILALPFLIIFPLLQITNIIGVKSQIARVLSTWERDGQLIENPSVNRYEITLGSGAGIDAQTPSSIEYSTQQTVEEINSFYLSRGINPDKQSISIVEHGSERKVIMWLPYYY